jgi:predicted RNA-binding Zn-ribbon protein involved in translation (DUF1610 family)
MAKKLDNAVETWTANVTAARRRNMVMAPFRPRCPMCGAESWQQGKTDAQAATIECQRCGSQQRIALAWVVGDLPC